MSNVRAGMRDVLLSTLVQPVWFVLVLPVVWLLFTGVFSRVSGWAILATQFRSRQSSSGETFRYASGFMGKRFFPVNYNGCLSIIVGEHGFGMSLLLLFRFQSPSLFIPWSEIESVERKKVFFLSYVVIHVREQWPIIAIRGKAGERIAETFAGLSSNRGSNPSIERTSSGKLRLPPAAAHVKR